jgi:hypothetical protein
LLEIYMKRWDEPWFGGAGRHGAESMCVEAGEMQAADGWMPGLLTDVPASNGAITCFRDRLQRAVGEDNRPPNQQGKPTGYH